MAIFEAKKKRGTLGFWYCLFVILISTGNWNCGCAARSEKEIRERFYGSLLNSSAPDSSDGSIAKMFDRVLEKEFSENDQPEGQFFFLCDFRFLKFFNLSSVWFPRKFLNGCIRPNLVEDKEMLEEKRIFSLLKFFFFQQPNTLLKVWNRKY